MGAKAVFLILAAACFTGVFLTLFIKQDLRRTKLAGKEATTRTSNIKTSLYIAKKLSLRRFTKPK